MTLEDCPCRYTNGYWARGHVRPLTPAELARADAWGDGLYLKAKRGGYRDNLGAPSAENHRLGARGELAFCVFMGIEWTPDAWAFHDLPDVPPDFEIRTARALRLGLKIRKDEAALDSRSRQRRFVLLTPAPKRYRNAYLPNGASFVIHGFARGYEAYGTPTSDPGGRGRPAHFLDVEALHSLPFDMEHTNV